MNKSSDNRRSVIMDGLRLLFFRSTHEELLCFGNKHLALGLVCTWLVGIGRHWDNPRVSLLQHLGVGSVVYIFVLALLLWLVAKPLKPKDWSYRRVLTFISLVSPPAILYAIPVERTLTLESANTVNALFLAIVSAWRVALLIFFLRRSGALDWPSVITATLLPLTLIVNTLAILNLERVVFDAMGGFRGERSPNDAAYEVLFTLSFLGFLLFLVVFPYYLYLTVKKANSAETQKAIKLD